MKRAFVLALACVIGLGIAAFAGPYFSLENTTLVLSPTLTMGVDFAASLGYEIPTPTLSGDFYTVIPNILAELDPETPWEFGAEIGISLEHMDCDFEVYFAVNPDDYPDSVEIVEDSAISLILTGKPGYPVEVWGGVELVYDDRLDQWELAPVFGIEVHW